VGVKGSASKSSSKKRKGTDTMTADDWCTIMSTPSVLTEEEKQTEQAKRQRDLAMSRYYDQEAVEKEISNIENKIQVCQRRLADPNLTDTLRVAYEKKLQSLNEELLEAM
jgi:flagellin-like hook-associated protein FlgL